MLQMESLVMTLGAPTMMLNKGALVFTLGALMMFLLLQMKAFALTCLRWGSLWWHHLWHLAQGRLQVILFTKRSNNISRSITSSSGFFTSASSINLTPDETGLSLPTTCHENLYQDLKILRMSKVCFWKWDSSSQIVRVQLDQKLVASPRSLSSAPFPATPCPVAPPFPAPPKMILLCFNSCNHYYNQL